MKKIEGKDQSLVRKTNLKMAFSLFKNNNYSTSQISKILKLSSSGAKYMVDEIIESGIIEVTPAKYTNRTGRTPVVYSLSPSYGTFGVINYYMKNISVYDLKGNLLYKEGFNYTEFVRDSDVENLTGRLKEILLLPQLSKRPLLALSVVYIGRISPDDSKMYLSYPFGLCTIDLFNHYKTNFNVPVSIMNNLHYALTAEKCHGRLQDNYKPCCYINNGTGLSAAFLINNELFSGAFGFAGEIGSNEVIAADTVLENFVSLRGLKIALCEKVEQGRVWEYSADRAYILNMEHEELLKIYNEGNLLLRELVHKSAYNFGTVLKNLNDTINFDTFIVTGKMVEYSGYLETCILRFNDITLTPANILTSALNDDAYDIGAMEVARDLFFDDFLKNKRKQTRKSSQ